MTVILGPLPCISCKEPVVWLRLGGLLRLMKAKNHQSRHFCVAKKVAA